MMNTQVDYATRVGRIMEWAQSQKRCPICKEEECDCWQALAAAPALLEALKEVADCLGELTPLPDKDDWLVNETGNDGWYGLTDRIKQALAQAEGA